MQNLSRFAPALFVLLWATGFIGARYAMPWAEPLSFLGVRFLIAATILFAILVLTRRAIPTARDAVHAAIAGILMHGFYLGGVFWAVRNGMPAGISALIVGLQPVLTALMAAPVLGEKILPRHWLGLVAGFVGVAIVLWPKLAGVDALTVPTLAAGFFAVVAMAAGTVWQKRFGGGAEIIGSTAMQYVGATVVMAAGSLAFETRAFQLTGELVFAMAWLVLVLSIGAIFLLMRLIREGAVSKVASLFYLVPAVTALIAWPLFGETLTAFQLLGMAITTVGVGLATAQPATRARASR